MDRAATTCRLPHEFCGDRTQFKLALSTDTTSTLNARISLTAGTREIPLNLGN
ncbi:hypothetical protein BAE44_0004194 [Dichanthelium oligosanthes]|uniref:Uncharacterized protein n=1 Tax=Dichanthelium oligosanthes TaxID=888268 RepID=A0A1E5WBM4_9POAL|nr:hypothetical protein BAE44_0004194 [Dichanthelium oligosanthes]